MCCFKSILNIERKINTTPCLIKAQLQLNHFKIMVTTNQLQKQTQPFKLLVTENLQYVKSTQHVHFLMCGVRGRWTDSPEWLSQSTTRTIAMATKSVALIAIEEHHMSISEGTELRKDVAAAAARIIFEKQAVCNFDWNPEGNSDLLLFWIKTSRRQIITHQKMTGLKWILKPCEYISISIHSPIFSGSFLASRWSYFVLYFGALLERRLHLHLCIHDEYYRTRLVVVYYICSTLIVSSNPPLLFEIILN